MMSRTETCEKLCSERERKRFNRETQHDEKYVEKMLKIVHDLFLSMLHTHCWHKRGELGD